MGTARQPTCCTAEHNKRSQPTQPCLSRVTLSAEYKVTCRATFVQGGYAEMRGRSIGVV